MKTPVSLLFIIFCSQAVFFTYCQPALAKSSSPHLSKTEPIDLYSAKFYNQRGTIRYKSKDYQGAIDDYNKAIEIKPKSFLYYNRANAKYKLGDKHGSIDDYTKAIKLNPYNIDAYCNLASTKSDLKDDRGAIADYTKIIELKPDYANAYYGRGNAKDRLGDKQNAVIDYTKAIKLNSNDANFYYNLGLTRSDLKDYQGAIIDHAKVIQLKPNHADAYYSLGNSKSKLGDKQGAITYYEQALQINPKHTQARQNLDLIKSDLGYQLSSSLSAHSLPLIMVTVSIASMGIWRSRKSSAKIDSLVPTIMSIIKPDIINEGQAAQFSAAATDIGSLDTLTYGWNFGDNTQSVLGRDPVHVFSSNGYYDVVLTVTDKDGGITTKTVRVKVNII